MKKDRKILLGKSLVCSRQGEYKLPHFELLKDGIIGSRIVPIGLAYMFRRMNIEVDYRDKFILDSVISGALSAVNSMDGYFARLRTVGSRNKSMYDKLCSLAVDLALYHNSYHNIFTIINDSVSSFKLLLYGKPGTGKSSIAKVLSSQFAIEYITDLSVKVHTNPATVYIIDDVDLLLSGREGDSNGKKNLANLLSILDKAERVILTTNKLDALDEAVTRPGRINHTFEVGYIDVESAKVIVKMTFADICGLETLPEDEVVEKPRFSFFNKKGSEEYKFLFYEFLEEVTEDVLAKVMKDSTDDTLSPARVKHTTKYFVSKCKSMYTESLSVDVDTSHLQVDENLEDFYTFRKETIISKVHRNFNKLVNFYNNEVSEILDMVIKIDDDSNNCDSRKFDFNKRREGSND